MLYFIGCIIQAFHGEECRLSREGDRRVRPTRIVVKPTSCTGWCWQVNPCPIHSAILGEESMRDGVYSLCVARQPASVRVYKDHAGLRKGLDVSRRTGIDKKVHSLTTTVISLQSHIGMHHSSAKKHQEPAM